MNLVLNMPRKNALSGCLVVTANTPFVSRKENNAAVPAKQNVPLETASYKPEDAVKYAAALRARPNRKPLSDFFSSISPATYGDGVSYQRQMRDEWNG
ncbi:MAG: hypothetical protein LBG72_09695 [Spirochaetaceae bacterium]|jgi:hypothetical protein|nr:hypothetical protein [Spirochaetaceae bacterium]